MMAKNSTVPQPSAAPPINPDARINAMVRFASPGRAAGGIHHPARRDHRNCSQGGVLDLLLQGLDPALREAPLGHQSSSRSGCGSAPGL
jgi:hypothetical protein